MVIAGPLGNVMLGNGMKHAGSFSLWPPAHLPHAIAQVLGNSSIWLGIASLLTFFIANLLVLSYADYSFVQPASSMAYGVTALLSYLLLHEHVSLLRWLGIAIICVGVLVVGRTNPRTERPSSPAIAENA